MRYGRENYSSGAMRHAITIERRTLAGAIPGSAEPQHTYQTIMTSRAAIETSRSSPSHGVNTDDSPTHKITIRYSSIEFDTRDRVRDVRGNLYTIDGVENVNQFNDLLVLSCTKRGPETTEANQ